ncbi:MAG TPA: hypothetical protein VGL28_07470 [Steroidobacteraceae bacterium]|jgi:hypothetical protein
MRISNGVQHVTRAGANTWLERVAAALIETSLVEFEAVRVMAGALTVALERAG